MQLMLPSQMPLPPPESSEAYRLERRRLLAQLMFGKRGYSEPPYYPAERLGESAAEIRSAPRPMAPFWRAVITDQPVLFANPSWTTETFVAYYLRLWNASMPYPEADLSAEAVVDRICLEHMLVVLCGVLE